MDRLISENKVLEAIDNLKANFTCYDSVTLDEVASHVKAIPSAEPSRDMEEIAEVINCDADAETKCKMISNILTAKPHYFEEQEPKTGQFAKWVATEIFDDMWEYNQDSFAEIACRKLEKLGIVRAKGDEWELIESEDKE